MPVTVIGRKVCGVILSLIVMGGLIPVASAVFDDFMGNPYNSGYPPCCPNYMDYPYYYYPLDPYYQFPLYCSCPFLNDTLARWQNWSIPYYYWGYIIEEGNETSSCSTCSGGSSTISYSNTPLIIPEKDSLMTAYSKISVSTKIISKDKALAKHLS
jgi:hypothetical protein